MPGTIGNITGIGNVASGQTVIGLIKGQAGTNIAQATLTAITYTVTRIALDKTETVTGTGSLSISVVVFDTAQTTDPRYDLAGGYNFLAVIPASNFPAAGRGLRHRISVLFDPVTGENFGQNWILTLL